MRDRERYDVVHLPLSFLADDVVVEALRRVRAALRPGGWLLTGTLALDGDDLAAAVSRLWTRLLGQRRAPPRTGPWRCSRTPATRPIRSLQGSGTLRLFAARRAA